MKSGFVQAEQLTLEDGRRAERHISYDDNGNEIVELFAEEPRTLKLEKRTVREFKKVISNEKIEMIKDGVVSYQEIKGQEEIPLQVRQRISIADHTKVIDGDYVRKEEIEKLITEGVIAGVSALTERFEAASQESPPVFTAMAKVTEQVSGESKKDFIINVAMVVVVLAQLAFVIYMFI